MSSKHVVRQGDCLSSIADRYGHFWETIWNHPDNAALKELRQDPNVLLPGDEVIVPDREEKEESGATAARHRFKKKGVPAKIRLKIMREPPPDNGDSEESGDVIRSSAQTPQDEVRADLPYRLDIDGQVSEGSTDSEGMIEFVIPPGARRGKIILEPNTTRAREIPLMLGSLDPISENRGIKQRLANLGFDCGSCSDDEMSEKVEAALRFFQEEYELEVTGVIDDATRNKLKEVHGS
ncbi:MAG: PGRP and LysM peptidoglycan-binding domain-containing protein [Thermodesulfobacteriota bacterium]